MYGTTEAAPRLTYLEPEKLFEKSGSIGKSIPNVDVYVANESGKRLPPGETGEIVFRGSNMMAGYWKDPEATATVIRNNIYFTGDLGKMDTDGYVFVVGRTKDMIKVGGNRVSSKEIEEALLLIEQIAETAVIGLPDPILGEAIKAYIVLKPGITIEIPELKKQLSQQIAGYKLPKFFEFIEDLPKNESGKIMKEKLKALNQ
jgi:acyl-coenzyme A synthetase/AMP-(fatty) acid ligase